LALDSRGIEPKKIGNTRCRIGIALTDEARIDAEQATKKASYWPDD
jgi:hypothetical protein